LNAKLLIVIIQVTSFGVLCLLGS